MRKSKLILELANIKNELGLSWSKVGLLVGRSKKIDFVRLHSWSESLIRQSIEKIKSLKEVQEAFDSGSSCCFTKFKDVAENSKRNLEEVNIKTYIDEIDGDYLISW